MAAISKIFICSTAYDLLDIRAEVCEFIKRLGYEVLNFEDPTFLTSKERISRNDMCLEGVKKADALITIINQRAGSGYDGDLFSDKNMTVSMAETRYALELGIQVVVFVRNETWDERIVYNKNRNTPPITVWVDPKNDNAKQVFGFIDYIQKNNRAVCRKFQHSVELRKLIGEWLDKISDRVSHSLISEYNAALIPAIHIEELIKNLYSVHRGEIWLFNNDLELLKSDDMFKKIYIETILPKLVNGIISSIKIILNSEKYLEFFDPHIMNPSRMKLLNNFSQLGKEIEKIYIARMDFFEPKINIGLRDHNLIFYIVDNDLNNQDSVCIIRHHSRPFTVDETGEVKGEDLVTICRRQDHNLVFFERCEHTFKNYFTNINSFGQLRLKMRAKHFSLKQSKLR